MARYMKLPQNQPVDMFNPINIQFYSSLLDKAQSNLTQAAAMQAKAQEDAYGIKHFDTETHNREVGKLTDAISKVTDEDFVSPARTVKTISKASAEFAPYKNLVERQVEEAKRQKEVQDRWGSDWIGNDITKESLTNSQTGELIRPEQLNGRWGNRQDLVSALEKDNAGIKDFIDVNETGLYPIMGGKFYQSDITKTHGLTKEKWLKQFKNNPGLVKQYADQMPGFVDAVIASGKNPEEYLADEIATISAQWIGGKEVMHNQIVNPDWGKKATDTDPSKRIPLKPTQVVPQDVKDKKVGSTIKYNQDGSVDLSVQPTNNPPKYKIDPNSGMPYTVEPGGDTPAVRTAVLNREKDISSVSEIRKKTGYDQIRPGSMTYNQWIPYANKNGFSTSELAYRNFLEKSNGYVVPTQKITEAYNNAIEDYSMVGGGYRQLPNVAGNSLGESISKNLSSTRAYVLDGRGSTKDKQGAWSDVADELGLSMDDINKQFKEQGFGASGITGRAKEPGLLTFDLIDGDGNHRTIYSSGNKTTEKAMKASHTIYNMIVNGDSGIAKDASGTPIIHESQDGSTRYYYEINPSLDINSKKFNPTITRITSVKDPKTGKWTATMVNDMSLEEIEDMELEALLGSDYTSTDVDASTTANPN